MKILELFSGYGTASFALKELEIDYELIGYSDIDKWANQVFKQNHCPNDTEDKLRLGDVKLIDPNKLEDFDLLTGGFPCQAFSVAGKGLGELDPRGTLFHEIIRIAEVKKPRFMLLENVKGLTNKNHRPTFEKILSELARIGYKVHWKILNTKDYGVPQNRERVWFVCFREQEDYDKFKFPEKEELKLFIKDILEPQVDLKYYLSEKLQERFKKYLEEKENKLLLALPTGQGGGVTPKIVSNSITTAVGRIGHSKEELGYIEKNMNCGQLRRLTPKECFRLMGFLKDQINLDGISDTQKYKLAGNGQSLNVVTKIFKEMFK